MLEPHCVQFNQEVSIDVFEIHDAQDARHTVLSMVASRPTTRSVSAWDLEAHRHLRCVCRSHEHLRGSPLLELLAVLSPIKVFTTAARSEDYSWHMELTS